MRRTDREITDLQEIYTMLERCTTVSLGFHTEDYPYVIPMTFGCRLEEGQLCVYFHCAGEGTKLDLLRKDPRICVEGHTYERVVQTEGGITAKYESVIGFGRAEKVEDPKEKVAAFRVMLEHYNSSGFPAESCKGLNQCEVYKIPLEQVTGKRNK